MEAIKLAVQLSNRQDVKEKIFYIPKRGLHTDWERWQNTLTEKAVETVKELTVSEEDKQQIIGAIEPIALRILSWARYCLDVFGISNDYSAGFLNDTFFTEQGIIDSEKVAKEIIEKLVNDEIFHVNTRYKLACIYCLEKYIPALWKHVLRKENFYNVENPDKMRIKQPELVKFWSCHLNGDIDKLKGKKSLRQYRFEAAIRDGSEVAVKYYWQKLKLSEKGKVIDFAMQTLNHKDKSEYAHIPFDILGHRGTPWFPVEYYNDILYFLLSQMKEEQKKEFFKRDVEAVKYSRVSYCFLEWPYQCFFIETAKLMWGFLPNSNYAKLLTRITDRFTNKGHYNYYSEKGKNDYDYYKLFKEFWSKSSDEYKRYILSDEENCDTLKGLLLKLFETERLLSSIDEKNVELIKLILKDATFEEKERVISFCEWRFLCNKLIIEEKWELLEEVIEKCTSSGEQVNQFKKDFVLYCDTLSYLIRQDKFSLMDKVEKWSTRSKEETEYKRKKFFFRWGRKECFDLIMEDNLEFAERFVRWNLSSSEEVKKFKKEFASNFGTIICKDLIANNKIEVINDEKGYYTISFRRINFQGGKWEQVEMFLTWAFSSEEEIREFKRNEVLESSGLAIHFQLIKANRFEDAETFFAWLELSKEEINKIKKETLLGDMFNSFVCSKDDDKELLGYGKSKQEAIELFLRWSFTDVEALLKFQNDFKRRFYGEMHEKRKDDFRDFNLAIDQCLNDLTEEEKRVKRKTESLDLPSKILCSNKVDQQICSKHL